jgi:hypothetical protein
MLESKPNRKSAGLRQGLGCEHERLPAKDMLAALRRTNHLVGVH